MIYEGARVDWSLLSNFAGLVLGAVGLLATAVQTVRVRRANQRRQEILRHVIDRANYASLDTNILIDLMDRHSDDPLLIRYLSSSRQVAADLYILAVDEYLSQEQRFTYDDLLAIADTPLVGGRWQMRVWIGKIALRKENKGFPAPEVLSRFQDDRLGHYVALRNGKSILESISDNFLPLSSAHPEGNSADTSPGPVTS